MNVFLGSKVKMSKSDKNSLSGETRQQRFSSHSFHSGQSLASQVPLQSADLCFLAETRESFLVTEILSMLWSGVQWNRVFGSRVGSHLPGQNGVPWLTQDKKDRTMGEDEVGQGLPR